MYTKAAIATFFAGLASAAPAPRANNNFAAIALHSTSAVHLQSINASGQRFYINKPTATYCPEVQNLNCSDTQTSVTVFGAQPNTESGLSLSVITPGGQQAYVAADGALGYTIAHSASIPQGAETVPFLYTPQASAGTVGILTFKDNSWYACPTGEANVYQVYSAAVRTDGTDCIGISFGTSEWTGTTAWQYT